MDTEPSDLEPIRERVSALRTHGWRLLAESSRVPFSTIRKFAYGEVREPLYETVHAIKAALPAVEAEVATSAVA